MRVVWIFTFGAVAGIVVLAIVVVVAGFLRRQQVSWALQAYCLARGWTHKIHDDNLCERWPDLPLSDLGAHARDIAEGDIDGVPFTAFTLVTGREGHPRDALRHVSGAGVVVLHTPSTIPWLTIAPNGFVEALREGTSGEPELTGDRDFDSMWRVYGDEHVAQTMLTSEFREWLMDPENSSSYGFDSGDVLTWSVERIQPRHIEYFVDQLRSLIDAVPSGVWALGTRNDSVSDPITADDVDQSQET